MELYPILECRNKLSDNLWYVITPSTSVQISGGVGSKACSRGSVVYITCGAQPDQSFGSVYKLSLDTFRLTKLAKEFSPRYEHGAALYSSNRDNSHDNSNHDNSNHDNSNRDNSTLVVFGGADTEGNRNDTQVLNIGTEELVTMTTGDTVPSPRTIHNTAIYKDVMYVWGGGDTGSEPVQDTQLHSLHLGSKEWRSYASVGSPPSPRHGHVICAVGDTLVLHGGMCGSEVYDDMYVTDISHLKEECTWRRLPSSRATDRQPVARAAHSSATHHNCLYIFGGFTGQEALADLWRFDIGREKWEEIAVPEPRPHPRLDQTICIASHPWSEETDSVKRSAVSSSGPTTAIHDITSLLHEAADNTLEEADTDLPAVSGYQDLLILFGGMDLQGNIFNDLYAIKL